MRAFLFVAIALSFPLLAFAQDAPGRVSRGQLVLENVPDAPADVSERLRQYVNTRGAGFQDWLSDGGVLIGTRFGDTVQLHRVDTPLGARAQLTFFDEAILAADARPDSDDILFVRDIGGNEQFGGYLFDPANGAATEFTAPGTRNSGFTWSHDGRLAAWSEVTADDADYDVYVGDPSDPSSRRLVLDGEGAIGPQDFSPDGTQLLLARYISIAETRMFLLDLASGALTQLTPQLHIAYAGGKFTPDGRAVVLVSDEGARVQRVVRIDIASGARTVLTPNRDWSVEDLDIADNGRTLAYALNVAGQSQLHLMDLRNGRALPAPDLPPGVVSGLTFDRDSRRLGFSFDSATSPSDVYSWDMRARALTRWTQSETGGVPADSFIAPELVAWSSFDGRDITGFHYQPRMPGPRPVVIYIHGGPESQFRPKFSSTFQYWINELNVAVIAPNVRGSDGYGNEFLTLDNAEKREDSVRDIGALLEWIAARPQQFDSSRVLVYGGSYGGYMVLAAMTHYNDRLAGAVDVVGISNFVTFLENTSGYRRDLRRAEYGDERDPDMRALLERISPLASAHRITKPLLIVHGANDPRVPVSEAEQLLAAVRANGGEAWLLLAMDEGHGFRRRANQEVQREAETMFFRHVLGLD